MDSLRQASNIIVRAFWELYFKRLTLFRGLIWQIVILSSSAFVLEQRAAIGMVSYWALIPAIYSYIMIVINTHRIVLLEHDRLPLWGEFRFTKRELCFSILGLVIILACIPAVLLAATPVVGYPLSLFGFAYVSARFSLVLPATAVDQNWSLQDAWSASQKHQLLMIFVVGVFPILISLPETLIGYLPYSSAVVYTISMLTTIYTIAALSLAFEDINKVKYAN